MIGNVKRKKVIFWWWFDFFPLIDFIQWLGENWSTAKKTKKLGWKILLRMFVDVFWDKLSYSLSFLFISLIRSQNDIDSGTSDDQSENCLKLLFGDFFGKYWKKITYFICHTLFGLNSSMWSARYVLTFRNKVNN